jgi:hypothetical protein
MTTPLHFFKTNALFFLSLFLGFSLSAQNEPFNCDYNAYLFQKNDVYALDLASGSSYLVAEDVTTGNINATGYNPADGYIWGSVSSPSKTIIRIGKNFEVESFYIDELPSSNRYIGDVSPTGVYYLKGGGSSYYKIDLNPESTNYTKYISTETLSKNLSIHDWAFNAADGNLYAVEKSSNHLYRINATTSEVLDLGEVPILSGLNYTYGAVYFDLSGRFYVSANQTGTVYVIQNVQDLNPGDQLDSNLFAYGPSSSSNDGARCPSAPVPQEDCANGVDDDGDGLVDCDDPACSGIAACPVVAPQVSSGNDGGLESNDRLSQQINQRNYLRKKANYKFDKATAKKFIKSKNLKRSTTEGFELKDLIPEASVIPGTTAIESSPVDLIAITNATELYSVDYIKDNETKAVVLATKTENGVYEHTKFICDRLLGAELLSVSTIELVEADEADDNSEGVHFIKSIIKNIDGSKEFVLSFSGKLINNNDNFEIDSHWNIDKYEANATYYNFQIWSNTIDDLYNLAFESLALFEVQKPITGYSTSTPPPVFVKKGSYKNGALDLELINVSGSESILVTGGFKRTETSVTEDLSLNVDLEEGYLVPLTIDTGNIFDIGFRIENDTNTTPDDLFMSDGVWGNDDSPAGTTVNEFTITQNENIYTGSGYRVERNIDLKATTSEYVAAYRSFTPRFTTVDLSDFDVLELDAKGTGSLEITIVKDGVEDWVDQFRTTIVLNDTESHFAIPFSHFVSAAGGSMDLSDAVNIVFTMSSDGVEVLEKEMNLKDILFTQQVLSVNTDVIALNEALLMPNPMSKSTTLSFYAETNTITKIEIYNVTGALVRSTEENTTIGNNNISLQKEALKTGIYFIKIRNDFRNYKTIKLVVN